MAMDFPYSKILPGVLYRDGLEASDYDEAIQALEDAKNQEGCPVCSICHDGHRAADCHHNPLVMARRAINAANVIRCYHCGDFFTDDAEAQEHFGLTERETPKCLQASGLGGDNACS